MEEHCYLIPTPDIYKKGRVGRPQKRKEKKMKAFNEQNTSGYTAEQIDHLNRIFDIASKRINMENPDEVQNLQEQIIREYDSLPDHDNSEFGNLIGSSSWWYQEVVKSHKIIAYRLKETFRNHNDMGGDWSPIGTGVENIAGVQTTFRMTRKQAGQALFDFLYASGIWAIGAKII
jgi:hypothetical protein